MELVYIYKGHFFSFFSWYVACLFFILQGTNLAHPFVHVCGGGVVVAGIFARLYKSITAANASKRQYILPIWALLCNLGWDPAETKAFEGPLISMKHIFFFAIGIHGVHSTFIWLDHAFCSPNYTYSAILGLIWAHQLRVLQACHKAHLQLLESRQSQSNGRSIAHPAWHKGVLCQAEQGWDRVAGGHAGNGEGAFGSEKMRIWPGRRWGPWRWPP